MSILEVLLAMIVLLVGVGALMAGFTSGMGTSHNQGQIGTATAVYARDKAEELLRLNYLDTSSDTTVFPPASTGGMGLQTGGSITPGTAVPGYVDYLDSNGGHTAAPGFYTRQWQITDNPAVGSPAAVHSKTITVAVFGRGVVANGPPPSTILVTVRSDMTW